MLNSHCSQSRRLVILVLGGVLLLCAGNGFGKAKHYGQLFAKSGRPRSGAELFVFKGKELAALYRDSEGKTKLENPVTTGEDGIYWFYADNGRYAIAEKAGSGYRVIDPELHVFDPSEAQRSAAGQGRRWRGGRRGQEEARLLGNAAHEGQRERPERQR